MGLLSLSMAANAYAATSTTPLQLIYQWANTYQVSASDMITVMNCESGGNPKAYNGNDPNGGSFGLFQYQIGTFKGWAKELGEERDIWDVEAQIRLTAYAFSKGRQFHWTCSKLLK